LTENNLDPHAILQFLNFPSPTAIFPVQGGTATTLWRIIYPDATYALRLLGKGREHIYEREIAVMQTASNAGLPVPQIHARGIWQDYPVILLSWLPGKPLADELLTHPWKAWYLGYQFGQMQARIHALTAPQQLLQETSWIDWQLAPHEEPLRHKLRSLPPITDRILHLDYHFLNVMTDGRTITGVLDWTNAHAGDPRADLARTYSIMQVGIPRNELLSGLLMLTIKIFEHGWRKGYEQKAGPQKDLSLFYAWAGALMEQDLKEKRAPADLARIHRWTMKWKEHAD
jgi:aminoglycoside phosphotransferase (APT) family kinase protein